MFDITISTQVRVPVKLLDSTTYAPKTGVSSPTIYIHKYAAGSTYLKSISPGTNWIEVDSANMPGVYDLLLSTTDTNTAGVLKMHITATSCAIYDTNINIVTGSLSEFANDVATLRKISTNRTKIFTTNNTFVVFDDDQTTAFKTFNLKDSNATSSSVAIYERVPV